VGTTDDLIVTPNEKVLYAVVSVGKPMPNADS
jgi:hypothetical protein